MILEALLVKLEWAHSFGIISSEITLCADGWVWLWQKKLVKKDAEKPFVKCASQRKPVQIMAGSSPRNDFKKKFAKCYYLSI